MDEHFSFTTSIDYAVKEIDMSNFKDTLEGLRRMVAVVARLQGGVWVQVLAFVDAVLASDELLKWIEELVNGALSQRAAAKDSNTDVIPGHALVMATADAGIDWLELFRVILPLLLQLLQVLLNDDNDGSGGGQLEQYNPADASRCS